MLYFHLCQDLVLETWSKGTFSYSLQICDSNLLSREHHLTKNAYSIRNRAAQEWGDHFLSLFEQRRREMAYPVLTKAFLQPIQQDSSHVLLPFRWHPHPLPPHPSYLLPQNLYSMHIVPGMHKTYKFSVTGKWFCLVRPGHPHAVLYYMGQGWSMMYPKRNLGHATLIIIKLPSFPQWI